MHTQKPSMGKFEGNGSQMIARAVYHASLESGGGIGDVETFGYYDYVEGKRYHFILSEDSQGFIHVQFGSPQEMQAKWDRIESAYEKFCEEQEEEELS